MNKFHPSTQSKPASQLHLRSPLLIKISFCGVFVGGLVAIIVTRLIFNQHHAHWYEDTIPSISKTGALAPADTVFAVIMGATGLFILATWIYTFAFNKAQIEKLDRTGAYPLWNKIVLALGLSEGVSVSLMAIISLEVHDNLHIFLSICVFTFGALAFLAESFALGRWRYRIKEPTAPLPKSFHLRQLTAVTVSILGLSFLYLFLERESGPIVDFYTTQIIYIANEHLLAILQFSYALLLLPEVLAHFSTEMTPTPIRCHDD